MDAGALSRRQQRLQCGWIMCWQCEMPLQLCLCIAAPSLQGDVVQHRWRQSIFALSGLGSAVWLQVILPFIEPRYALLDNVSEAVVAGRTDYFLRAIFWSESYMHSDHAESLRAPLGYTGYMGASVPALLVRVVPCRRASIRVDLRILASASVHCPQYTPIVSAAHEHLFSLTTHKQLHLDDMWRLDDRHLTVSASCVHAVFLGLCDVETPAAKIDMIGNPPLQLIGPVLRIGRVELPCRSLYRCVFTFHVSDDWKIKASFPDCQVLVVYAPLPCACRRQRAASLSMQQRSDYYPRCVFGEGPQPPTLCSCGFVYTPATYDRLSASLATMAATVAAASALPLSTSSLLSLFPSDADIAASRQLLAELEEQRPRLA